jgi:hypothetical protein
MRKQEWQGYARSICGSSQACCLPSMALKSCSGYVAEWPGISPNRQETRSNLNRPGIMAISDKETKWIRLLAYVTGLVNQELLLQNEYLAAENRVLRAYLPARLR